MTVHMRIVILGFAGVLLAAGMTANSVLNRVARGGDILVKDPDPVRVQRATKSHDFLQSSRSFFQQYCNKCHTGKKPKGGLRLDSLDWKPGDKSNLKTWQEIGDRLSAGDMPPKDQRRPPVKELATVKASIRGLFKSAATSGGKSVVLRRLNRIQYRNTIRDLLRINVDLEDPTKAFPADDTVEGFDNIGEGLKMSDFLMRQYLRVARLAVDRATSQGDRPTPSTYRMFEKSRRRFGFRCQHCPKDRGRIYLYMNDEREPGDPRGQSLTTSREGAPRDSWYEFTFDVESKGRGNFAKELSRQERKEWQVYRPEDLHRLEIYFTPPHGSTPIQTRPRILAESLDLPDNKRLTLRRRFWLTKGWRLEVAFGNGWASSNSRHYPKLIGANFDEAAFDKLSKREQKGRLVNVIHDQLEKINAPRIVVYGATETGPIYDQWPPTSHQKLYGKAGRTDEQVIREFALRAFRRPATDRQLAPYFRLAKQSSRGVRAAIEAMLCSPRFLYFSEPEGELDSYAIASRLSYFLWNTMPDETLFALAAKDKLRDPSVLQTQVERMLADPRSSEFVNRFTWAWLKLQNTVAMAPDPTKFYQYHRNRIAKAMVAETRAFFRHVLDNDLPVSTFIDSEFTFLNADLGRLYGIPGVKTTVEFQKVALKPSHRRGGLLGHAAVLTASANGVDTSPIVRGIWVLDNLLGTPPAPPPADVSVPEPDARGKLTIRQLFAKHRTIESCSSCHRKIDPLGFALENYDPIGRWRTHYPSGHAIDTSGKMPDGNTFQDAASLKRLMLADVNLFTRNLTSRILTYATGRTMDPADRPEIDRIVAGIKKKKYGLRQLIHEIVKSTIFLRK